ncbi:hypothetical protein PO883_33730 [Massilia sp. DJPM01]|uniref:hypothetical protein n=1 Tax=Massilia sp. DJPM01 TaxID=3024404 RepID=UPI00259DF5E4|nr:hypothetical protein [Massilia sp. DJPM01]MDM5182134.1 hypothetical protein [Massilia sp. DJPM01]
MTEHLIDFTAVRTELRALDRGSLLIISERAIELMPATQLSILLSDFVRFTVRPSEAGNAAVSLLDEVRAFYDAAMAGNYYEPVEINNRGRQKQSEGTDAFIAEFHRLLHECIRASDQEVPSGVSESFEFLFGLLSHIDEGNDDVLFFADDGSSLNVGVNWRTALPTYFKCLAETSSPERFARTVVEVIADFVTYDQPLYFDVARNVANDAQRTALETAMP